MTFVPASRLCEGQVGRTGDGRQAQTETETRQWSETAPSSYASRAGRPGGPAARAEKEHHQRDRPECRPPGGEQLRIEEQKRSAERREEAGQETGSPIADHLPQLTGHRAGQCAEDDLQQLCGQRGSPGYEVNAGEEERIEDGLPEELVGQATA